MKKQVRAIIIATIITIITIVSCAYAMPVHAEGITSEDYYGKLTVVVGRTQLESHLWVIECKDKDGEIWTFLDDEGTWARGDIVNLLMFRISENTKNDEAQDAIWEGHTDDLEMFFQVMGWRQ